MIELFASANPAGEEREHSATIVLLVALATAAGLATLSLYRIFIGEFRLIPPFFAGFVAVVGVLILLRRGLVDWSSVLLSWTMLALLEYLAWTNSGITDSALMVIPGVLIFGGLVMKGRHYLMFGAASLLSVLVLGWLEVKGALPVTYIIRARDVDVLDVFVIFALTAGTVRLMAHSFVMNLSLARTNEKRIRQQSDLLRRSEERYRALFEGANDAILILNEQGFVECNSMALEMYGCRDRSEIVGKAPWDFSAAQQPDGSDSKDKAQIIIRDVVRGNSQRTNWKHVRKNGTVFDAEVSLSCLDGGRDGLVQAIVRDATERLESEKALRKSDERFRLLFDSIQDAVFVHAVGQNGMPGVFLEANQAACRRLGYTRDELLKMSPLDIDAPDTLPRVPDAMNRVAQNGSATWEGAHISRDGRRIPVEISNYGFTLEGKPTILATVRDITERRVVENALRESEEQFRTIVETTSEWIWGLSVGGVHTYSNPAVEAILGYQPDDLCGKSISSLMHDEDWANVERMLPICARERKGWRDLVIRWRHKDGAFRYLESNATPVLDREGEVVGFRGADRDITDRKLMEDKLRMSEEYYRTLVETSPDAIIIVDPNGFISFVSPRAYELFGVPPGNSAIGTSVFDWVPPEGRVLASSLLERTLSNELKLSAFEIELLRQDQTTFWAEVSASVLANARGDIRGLLVICRDVTDRRETELALRQAQRMESIGILAGGIAHDFNNLLQAILGQSHLALSKLPGGHAGRANIEKAEKAAERAAELTRQLLAYSGQGRLTMRPIDVNSMLKENIHLVEFAIPRNVAIELNLFSRPLIIKGDNAQVQQVVMNLVINAAEAYDGRSGTIRIRSSLCTIESQDVDSWTRAGAEIDPGTYVVLEVTDNGCGMDRETVARVFDPFFSTKFTGRGLGLAAVLGIVRGHGGALQVGSERGTGTSFRVAFPQTEQAMQSDQSQMPSTGQADGKTILLIDDEEVVRDVFAETLTDAGWNVLTAGDGESGIRMFNDHPGTVGLVVLDLSMPGMDGAETLRRLRGMDPTVKVVLSSGYGEEEAMGRFEGLGLSGFLQKPYNWSRLKEILASYLQ
jgi:two-component system, cell cycle sensor histidine kinase and response regulator CckA